MDIIDLFIDNPHKKYHVREVARLTTISGTTASYNLKKLKKEGLLESKEERNHLLYQANTENKTYKDLKLAYNIKKIRNSGIIEHLNEFYNQPSTIILFGSFRKAENTAISDVDLVIITPNKKYPDLEKFEKKLKHKIELHIFSKEKIKEMKNKNKELMNNIINGIVLEGYFEVF